MVRSPPCKGSSLCLVLRLHGCPEVITVVEAAVDYADNTSVPSTVIEQHLQRMHIGCIVHLTFANCVEYQVQVVYPAVGVAKGVE